MAVEYKFDYEEEETTQKVVYTIAGEKGSGKSVSTMLLRKDDESMLVISFDHKSAPIKKNTFNDNPKIKVFNGIKYYDRSPDKILETSKKTYEFIKSLVGKWKPDWICIDGLETLNIICEMTMRNDRGYKPYAGITNMNDWKYRNDMLSELHSLALVNCKKGVVYTTYVVERELYKNGQGTGKFVTPKWVGSVMTETDIVLMTKFGYDTEGNEAYEVFVDSSKFDNIFKSRSSYVVDLKKGFIKK